MIRLNRPQLTSLRPLFDTSILRLVGESMLAANTKGTAWVDSLSAPKLALIHEGSCVFVSGDSDRHDSVAVLAGLLGAEAGERGFLKLLCTPDDGRWDGVEILPTRFEDGIQRRIYPRIESDDRAVVDTLPPEIELKQIDRALLLSALTHVESLKDEIAGGWSTEEVFLEHGFGFVVVSESAVLSWCTGEYLSPGRIGIGIETVEDCQGNGYATMVAREFVRHAKGLGLSPHWDCWTSNTPSVRVAEKIGFTDAEEYRVTTGTFVARA